MNDYNDIINMPHHVSKIHKQMSIEERSAQFAPFSALTGYNSSISEASKTTNKKIILADDYQEELSNKLLYIKNHIKERNVITITYFLKDKTRPGGNYLKKNCIVKKIDLIEKKLIFFDKTDIFISDIIKIDIN